MDRPQTSVELRIRQPAELERERVLSRTTFFKADGEDLVFRSMLSADHSASEHLKWFYGMLRDHRKLMRQLEVAGSPVIIIIRTQQRPTVLEPEALLLAHQLHLTIEVRGGK